MCVDCVRWCVCLLLSSLNGVVDFLCMVFWWFKCDLLVCLVLVVVCLCCVCLVYACVCLVVFACCSLLCVVVCFVFVGVCVRCGVIV